MTLRRVVAAALLAGAVLTGLAGGAEAAEPTCADTLGLAVHGQHIVGDYVTGSGVSWPPAGQVGAATGGQGAALPGGPGPAFHFLVGAAPGASFCNPQSQSPGFHLP